MPNLEPVSPEAEALARARRRVQELKGFYLHGAIYAIVNVGLVFVYAFSSAAGFWPIWPILGWGVGLATHGLATFRLVPSLFSKGWEERKVQKYLEKEKDG